MYFSLENFLVFFELSLTSFSPLEQIRGVIVDSLKQFGQIFISICYSQRIINNFFFGKWLLFIAIWIIVLFYWLGLLFALAYLISWSIFSLALGFQRWFIIHTVMNILLLDEWLTFVFGQLNRSIIGISIKEFWLNRLIPWYSLRFLKERFDFSIFSIKAGLLVFAACDISRWKMTFWSDLL